MIDKFLWFNPSPPGKKTLVFLPGGDGSLFAVSVKPCQSMGCHPSLADGRPFRAFRSRTILREIRGFVNSLRPAGTRGGGASCFVVGLSEMPSRWDSGDVGFVSVQIYLKCRPAGLWGYWPCLGANLTKMSSRWDSGGYWPCLGANLTKMSSRWDSGGCWPCLGANLSKMSSRWDSGVFGRLS